MTLDLGIISMKKQSMKVQFAFNYYRNIFYVVSLLHNHMNYFCMTIDTFEHFWKASELISFKIDIVVNY